MDEGSVHGYGYSDNPSFGYGDTSGDVNFQVSAAPSWENPSSGGGGFDDPSSGGGFEVFAASSSESGKKFSIDHVPGVFPDIIVEEL